MTPDLGFSGFPVLRVDVGLLADGPSSASNSALITFALYTLGVFGLAWASNRLLKSRNFMSEYFLGSRSLGMWAFALTFAATSSSGGSFTGFPALIYTHGWIMALWIASYMVVPICTMGLLGKRINQVARKSGAITVPDVIRDRFGFGPLGLMATLLIVFFMSINLVAQFKGGSLILRTLLSDVGLFQSTAHGVEALGITAAGGWMEGVDPGYLVCLVTFAIAVIVYTTYGGFHAVVWTDVMQGVVMVAGVMIMLPLALSQVGGLTAATTEMAQMVPPKLGDARLELDAPRRDDLAVPAGTWFELHAAEEGASSRLIRTTELAVIPAGSTTLAIGETEDPTSRVAVLEMVRPTEGQLRRIRQQLAQQDETLGERVSLVPETLKPYAFGADEPGTYVAGPGPSKDRLDGFLPLSLAVSFFFMWSISGAGQPSNMVRLMAFNSSTTLRRAIFTVSIYYTLIYFPLVIIFCCGRVLLPGMEGNADAIMPSLTVELTRAAGWPWLAGLLVAAPFAAIMSTVDSFLLMISSALVRDVYQRNINPAVEQRNIKRMSYLVTFVVGTAAMVGAVNPPQFLQSIIVYTGSGLAAAFLIPVILALYWPRANWQGAAAGMLGGFLSHLALYVAGYRETHRFEALQPLGIDPILWGLFVSLAIGIGVTLLTPPPPEKLVQRYFCAVRD
jgi:Na+/pantothenate symporter